MKISNSVHFEVGMPFHILVLVLVKNESNFILRHHHAKVMRRGLSANSFINVSDLTCSCIVKGTMEVRQVELIANR